VTESAKKGAWQIFIWHVAVLAAFHLFNILLQASPVLVDSEADITLTQNCAPVTGCCVVRKKR
jgi:hypothetical protein